MSRRCRDGRGNQCLTSIARENSTFSTISTFYDSTVARSFSFGFLSTFAMFVKLPPPYPGIEFCKERSELFDLRDMSSFVVLYSSTVRYALTKVTIQTAAARSSFFGCCNCATLVMGNCVGCQGNANERYFATGSWCPEPVYSTETSLTQIRPRLVPFINTEQYAVSGGGYGWKDWNCQSGSSHGSRSRTHDCYLSLKRHDVRSHLRTFAPLNEL